MDGMTAMGHVGRHDGDGRRDRDATSTAAMAMEGATAMEGVAAMDDAAVTAMATVAMDDVRCGTTAMGGATATQQQGTA